MTLPQAQSFQMPLPGVEPPEPIAAAGARDVSSKSRSASSAPRSQSLQRDEAARNSMSVMPRQQTMAQPSEISTTSESRSNTDKVAMPLEGRFPAGCIRPNNYHHREASEWQSKRFQELKQDIKRSNGNIQPIKLRRVAEDGGIEYEIVYGQRRHRACLDLDLPVYAVVEDLSDLQLFTQMVRENSNRRDCSPYARGIQFLRAIERELVPEDADWHAIVGVTDSMVYKLLKLARLPVTVVEAFACPSHIHANWGSLLAHALQRDEAGVLKRAAEMARSEERKSPKAVLEFLLNEPNPTVGEADRLIPLVRQGVTLATLRIPAKATGEGIQVKFVAGAVNEELLLTTLTQMLRADAAGEMHP